MKLDDWFDKSKTTELQKWVVAFVIVIVFIASISTVVGLCYLLFLWFGPITLMVTVGVIFTASWLRVSIYQEGI